MAAYHAGNPNGPSLDKDGAVSKTVDGTVYDAAHNNKKFAEMCAHADYEKEMEEAKAKHDGQVADMCADSSLTTMLSIVIDILAVGGIVRSAPIHPLRLAPRHRAR